MRQAEPFSSLHSRHTDPLDQHHQLGAGDFHRAPFALTQLECPRFQALVPETQPVPAPIQHLQPIPAMVAEHEQMPRQWVLPHHFGGHGRQPVEPLAHIRYLGAHEHPDSRRECQHASASSACAISARTEAGTSRYNLNTRPFFSANSRTGWFSQDDVTTFTGRKVLWPRLPGYPSDDNRFFQA